MKTQWISFLQTTYQQLETKKNTSKNPLVRLQLDTLEVWMKREYALSDTERTTVPIRKDQVFLTKDGKKMVRRWKSMGSVKTKRESNILVDISSRNKKPEVKRQKSVESKQPLEQNREHHVAPQEKVKMLPKKSDSTFSPSDTEKISISDRYNLRDGRINITTLRNMWISWVNDFRVHEWVSGKITYSARLSKTATERSYKMRSDGHRSHKRFADSWFYNYKELEEWFAQRWIVFKNVNRTTFTENVGQGYLTCKKGDCTKDALRSLRNTFDYFVGEKNQSYKAHYQTLVKPEFKIMWFGIAVDEKNNTFYSTMHYGTEIVK